VGTGVVDVRGHHRNLVGALHDLAKIFGHGIEARSHAVEALGNLSERVVVQSAIGSLLRTEAISLAIHYLRA